MKDTYLSAIAPVTASVDFEHTAVTNALLPQETKAARTKTHLAVESAKACPLPGIRSFGPSNKDA